MSELTKDILQTIRKSHRISRKGLEVLSGFKERTIASYERGENKPSDKYITFISLYFNVSEDWIKNGFINISDKYKGGEVNKYAINRVKRIVLMYQDVYGFDNITMSKRINTYRQVIESSIELKGQDYAEEIYEISKELNIKPSCFGLTYNVFDRLSHDNEIAYIEENKEDFHEDVESLNKYIDSVNTNLKLLEKNGLDVNKDYYAEMIKKRNLAKENYVPVQEPKKLDEKYQRVVELLPYASDTFLNELYKKLKAIKELQTL